MLSPNIFGRTVIYMETGFLHMQQFRYAKTKTQIRTSGNFKADQRLCFRCTDSSIPLPLSPKLIPQAMYSVTACTVRFVSHLFRNLKQRPIFSFIIC